MPLNGIDGTWFPELDVKKILISLTENEMNKKLLIEAENTITTIKIETIKIENDFRNQGTALIIIGTLAVTGILTTLGGIFLW